MLKHKKKVKTKKIENCSIWLEVWKDNKDKDRALNQTVKQTKNYEGKTFLNREKERKRTLTKDKDRKRITVENKDRALHWT